MTGERKSTGAGGTAKDVRAERLGHRLRENLRRRKAQARARREADVERSGTGGPPAERASGEED